MLSFFLFLLQSVRSWSWFSFVQLFVICSCALLRHISSLDFCLGARAPDLCWQCVCVYVCFCRVTNRETCDSLAQVPFQIVRRPLSCSAKCESIHPAPVALRAVIG